MIELPESKLLGGGWRQGQEGKGGIYGYTADQMRAYAAAAVAAERERCRKVAVAGLDAVNPMYRAACTAIANLIENGWEAKP